MLYTYESNSGRQIFWFLTIRGEHLNFIGVADAINSCPDNSFYENKYSLTKKNSLGAHSGETLHQIKLNQICLLPDPASPVQPYLDVWLPQDSLLFLAVSVLFKQS